MTTWRAALYASENHDSKVLRPKVRRYGRSNTVEPFLKPFRGFLKLGQRSCLLEEPISYVVQRPGPVPQVATERMPQIVMLYNVF